MAVPKKRITLQSLEPDGARVTALCAATLPETRELVGKKLGFEKPSLCRLFNKHGAEIDHLDLVMHDDLLYASAGGPFPRTMKTRPSSSHGTFLLMRARLRSVLLLLFVRLQLLWWRAQQCQAWHQA
jgi:hypothetical protein